MDVFRIKLHCALEGNSNFARQAKRTQRVGMRGLESVGPPEPHLIVTAGGGGSCCKFTLMDGVIGHLLSIVNAAEKLMGLGIARLCGQYLAKTGGCFIDAALLEKHIGLSCVGNEEANAEEDEEKKRKGKANMGPRCRNEHD